MTEKQSVRPARLCAGISLILLLAVLMAGSLRSANEERPTPVQTRAPQQEIAAFASDRNALRREEIERLEELIKDPASGEGIRAAAQERMMLLLRWMEQEATVEAVLSARGYETPVVTVHSDSVNVVVRDQELTREEAGVILELVMRETGATGGNVKIIPIN